MRPSKQPTPYRRDGVWYLRRRVPKRYLDLEDREYVWVSTGISIADDPKGQRARESVNELNSGLEASWQLRREGRADDAKLRFEAAQKRARSLQLPYLTNAELAAGPIDEIMKRMELLISRNSVDDAHEAFKLRLLCICDL